MALACTPRGTPHDPSPSGTCVTGNPRILKIAVYAALKGLKIGWLWYNAAVGWGGTNKTPSSPSRS